ncbi:hypothetical protein IU433_00100 [Nocardia puris]|uniref:hypothetical protein n=1 Tax=Nocardia puris TaxID=208602 RepID=UPI001894B80F|nr:hypothetical protein [Nocardia puris]MBF6210188.1 hypothetical protein [Nocardia puris]MBF6457449.1 hypothetical protein [Nocardia puris]
MTIEHPIEDEVTQLARRVEKARGRLAYQFDPALTEALSEDELHAERELAERIREQERAQRWKEVQAAASASDRSRLTAEEIAKADMRDLLVARKAIAAQRRESSPHAKLASLYRHRAWSLRALAGVVGAGMLWSAVNVQQNIAPGGPSDPLFWFSYLLEGMISVCLIIIMIGTNKVAEWGVMDNRGQVAAAEIALLGLTVGLNTYPYVRAGEWYEVGTHAIAPVMIGVALLIHDAASARYGLAIARATEQIRDLPDPAEEIRRRLISLRPTPPPELVAPPEPRQALAAAEDHVEVLDEEVPDEVDDAVEDFAEEMPDPAPVAEKRVVAAESGRREVEAEEPRRVSAATRPTVAESEPVEPEFVDPEPVRTVAAKSVKTVAAKSATPKPVAASKTAKSVAPAAKRVAAAAEPVAATPKPAAPKPVAPEPIAPEPITAKPVPEKVFEPTPVKSAASEPVSAAVTEPVRSAPKPAAKVATRTAVTPEPAPRAEDTVAKVSARTSAAKTARTEAPGREAPAEPARAGKERTVPPPDPGGAYHEVVRSTGIYDTGQFRIADALERELQEMQEARRRARSGKR